MDGFTSPAQGSGDQATPVSTAANADIPPSAFGNVSFNTLQTEPSHGIAPSPAPAPAPKPPSLVWDGLLRRAASRPAIRASFFPSWIPKKRRSVADFAAQVVKDPKGTWKRIRRSKSTATIATLPLRAERPSPEALRQHNPEETPYEVNSGEPRAPWIDPSDMKGPEEDKREQENEVLSGGRMQGAPQLSDPAISFWSRLELVSTYHHIEL